MSVEDNSEFAKRMRRKREPATPCARCGEPTRPVDGMHQCDGVPPTTTGPGPKFKMHTCHEQLCERCAQCHRCEAMQADRGRQIHDFREAERKRREAADAEGKRRALLMSKSRELLEKGMAPTTELAQAFTNLGIEVQAELMRQMILKGVIRLTQVEADNYGVTQTITWKMMGSVEDISAAMRSVRHRNADATFDPYRIYPKWDGANGR